MAEECKHQQPERPGWDEYFMRIAQVVALRSNCSRRQVAAVIVKDHRIISTGYNGTPRGIKNCNEGGCPRCSSDAPSGTALALADSINEELDPKYEYVYDRSTRREKRPVGEIGISAVRGGSIVGDHAVIFAGQDEVVTFSHRAYSRAIFGKGAIEAAKFLKGCL